MVVNDRFLLFVIADLFWNIAFMRFCLEISPNAISFCDIAFVQFHFEILPSCNFVLTYRVCEILF
jgi:hypothetical protein